MSRPSVRAPLALLALVGLGCGGASVPSVGPGVRIVGGSLDATALLTPTSARAGRGGAGPLALVTSGLLREGDRTGAFVESLVSAPGKPASCLFLFARGAPSIADLDLSLYSDEGEPLAQDEEPDATPALVLCPPYPARMYVSARAAAGEGLVSVGAQTVPQPLAEAVRRAASARGGLGVVNRRLEQWPELEAAVSAELARLGAGSSETHRVGVPGDRLVTTSFTEEIAAGTCASLLLVPEPSLFGLDVELQDQDGALLLRSARPTEALASLGFCTDTARTITASFRPHVGRGLVGAVWFRAPRELALGARVLATRSGEQSTWLRDEVKRLGVLREARGQRRVQATSFTVKPSALVHRTLAGLDPEACHAITAVVGGANARVSLSVLDADTRPLVARQGGAHASAVVCGLASVEAAVGIREAQGEGLLLVHRLARAPGAPAVVKAPAAASRTASLLDDLGLGSEHGVALQGAPVLSVIEIPRGRCVVAAASSEAGAGATLDATEIGPGAAGADSEAGASLLTRGDAEVRWVRLCAEDGVRRVRLRASASLGLATWGLVPIAR